MKYEWTSSVSGVPIWNIPVGDDGDANAWAQAVVANGGTVSAARKRLVGTTIQKLKAGGIWDKFDALWLFAAENSASALTDIKARTNQIATGGPAFVVDRGYSGEDLASPAKYITTAFTMDALSKFSLNSAHLSAWITTNTAIANGGVCLGVSDGTNVSYLINVYNDGRPYFRVNDDTELFALASPISGHWISNRISSTQRTAYRNGSLFDTANVNSTSIPTLGLYILALNASGVVIAGNSNQHAAVSIGSGFTATEAALYFSVLRDYMNAVGAP